MSFRDVYLKFVESYQRVSNDPAILSSNDDIEMPCFYLRNESSIALFKIDAETHSPIAELIPSHNLEKQIKDTLSANVYTVHKIYEDDNEDNAAESRKVQSTMAKRDHTEKTTSVGGVGENNFENEDGSDEHLDLDDLMEEMHEPLNLAESENLKLSSMHHFNLKPRDVVSVYKFSGRQSCHVLYTKLLNYVSMMNEKRKRSKEGP